MEGTRTHRGVNPAGGAIKEPGGVQGFGILHNSQRLVLTPTLIEHDVRYDAGEAPVLL